MDKRLTGYEILLGVTGGIAAYKAAMLCSRLVQAGAQVTVAMTEHARAFVGELTFGTLSGRAVYSELFGAREVYGTEHIGLTERADLIVVAPATANIIAKAAAGICDDLLSTLLAAADSPVLLAPAMNERMWRSPMTQRNVETLKAAGYRLVGPGEGHLACGESGVGRMSEPEEILAAIETLLRERPAKKRMRL